MDAEFNPAKTIESRATHMMLMHAVPTWPELKLWRFLKTPEIDLQIWEINAIAQIRI